MTASKSLIAAALLGAATAFTSPAFAGDMKHDHASETVIAGDLQITGYWTRAMLPGQKVAGGYVTVANKGGSDDRLVAVATPMAGRGEIHEMAMVDDVMKMRPLPDGLPIPAGETLELKPGGYHLMFMAVETPFQEGDMVPVTLTFDKAGDVSLTLPVMPAGTRQMDHSKHGS